MEFIKTYESYQGEKRRDYLTKKAMAEVNYYPLELPAYAWHQTALSNALAILSEGFKTGYELQKGEANNAIYFSPTVNAQKGLTYARGAVKEKVVLLRVNIEGLKVLDTSDFKYIPELPSYEQPYYTLKQEVEIHGIPDGYDMVVLRNNAGHEEFEDLPKNITEIILPAGIANSRLVHELYNNKGQVIK